MQADPRAHRQRVLEHLAEDEAVLVFGAHEVLRNGDAEHRYRQSSDVLWLTGWEEPDVAVFLRPGAEPLTMFVAPRDKEREVWTGRRIGPEGAKERFGADQAYAFEEITAQLPRLLQGVRALHYAAGKDEEHDAIVHAAIAKAAKASRLHGLSSPETFHLPAKLLAEMRLLKTEQEIALLQAAADLTGEGHRRAMQLARPGLREYHVEAELFGIWRRGGSTGPGYTPIVAAGVNATVLHYVGNRDELRDGELLLLDAGCEVEHYTADVTRTFPINGTFSPVQRDVYGWVLRAQLASIDACRAGRPFVDVHDASVRVLTEGMVALGLLEGPPEERIADESYKRYYMHGTSHWLGLDVHDAGLYGRAGATRTLGPGMVLTVEPGLYIDPDDADAPAALRGIGIRLEDDVLVTDGEPRVLTASIPKTIDEVEAACRG